MALLKFDVPCFVDTHGRLILSWTEMEGELTGGMITERGWKGGTGWREKRETDWDVK